MNAQNIANLLKYINVNGVTLNIEERLNLDLALSKLQLDFQFEGLFFWGKVNGIVNDYYVAIGLKFKGQPDFPKKSFFWCSSTNWTFAELPQPLCNLKCIFDKIQVFFTGEFDRIVIEPNGKSPFVDVEAAHTSDKPLELPKKGVTELDRLAYVVAAIEDDCQVVPVGSFKLTPLKECRRNEAWKGSKLDQAFKLSNYQHFRKVQSKEKRELIDRDEGFYCHQFLDDIENDLPQGAWGILKDTTESVAILRNKTWPGYYAFNKVNAPIFGSVYMGNGLKNLDLPFML